jgi:hypothetical protein
MLAALLEKATGGNKIESIRGEEEACRKKIVTLRKGLQHILTNQGARMNDGVSNVDLVNSVAQFRGAAQVNYAEHLAASWREEYERFVRSVGSLIGNESFSPDTDPNEVIRSVIESSLVSQFHSSYQLVFQRPKQLPLFFHRPISQ